LPGWWIIAGYSPNLETAFFLMALFMIGAIIMRAAGCVINDLWDRNIDKQVARTKDRPLASGEITPFRAVAFLVFLTVLGLGLLVQLSLRTWIVGASAAPLIILYPLAKRVFGFPQLVLGLTFSWGLPVAASILWAGMPPFGLFLVYAGTVFWVIGYDTIYAIQDMPDDRATGVKSSALTLGARLKAGVALFYGAATACWFVGFYSLSGPDIWLFGVLAAGVHLGRQALQIDIATPDTALRLFTSNRDTGLLVTAALLAQQII
jgi:4-hydroxybenzoate polyprenyltransferase